MVERDRQVTLGSNAFRLLRIAVEGANAVWVAFRRAVARFRNDEDGMYLVYLTAAMPVLLGFVSLGSEAGSLFYAKQSLQAAADSAAVSAATAYGANAPINTEAYAIAAQYGFVNNTNGVIVHAYQPPQSGPYSGNSNAVEVTVSRPQAPLFSSDWISQPFAVSATAVAVLANGGDCVLALDPTAQKAVQASGSAAVIMTNCGLFSDSDASTSNNPSILVSGGAKFTAQSVGAVGTVCSAGGTCPPPASLMTPTPTTGDKSISNPYASVAMPTYSGCNSTNYSPDTNQTLTPVGGVYVFCGNVNIGGSNKVTLNTGTYIVNGGSFSVSGSATLTSAGADVTLVFTSGATANISGALNLTAPTTGALAGLAMFEDPAATVNNNNKFTFQGGSNMYIDGAIVLATAAVTYQGGSSSASPCTQLIADTINFTGSASFANGCVGTGTRTIGATAKLVE